MLCAVCGESAVGGGVVSLDHVWVLDYCAEHRDLIVLDGWTPETRATDERNTG